jgi:FkbM family methyltransferase
VPTAPQRGPEAGAAAPYDHRVPPVEQFISYAQNAEDVVLWRAFGELPTGRYVEVGANHPSESSITRAFYDRGWTGVEIEPVTEFVELYRAQRPGDVVVQAAVTDEDIEAVTLYVIDGTGLSTLDPGIAAGHRAGGWETRETSVPARRLDDVLDDQLAPEDDIHFMVIDAEGSERAVLASVDLRRWRPRVLVVEATAPNSTQPTHEQWEKDVLAAGYELCLFDGLSRFYVADEHASELRAALSVPANPLDDFTTAAAKKNEEDLARLQARQDELLEEVVRWRGAVLARWADAAGSGGSGQPGHEVVRLRRELAETHATVSWRVTAPLRAVQARRLRGPR